VCCAKVHDLWFLFDALWWSIDVWEEKDALFCIENNSGREIHLLYYIHIDTKPNSSDMTNANTCISSKRFGTLQCVMYHSSIFPDLISSSVTAEVVWICWRLLICFLERWRLTLKVNISSCGLSGVLCTLGTGSSFCLYFSIDAWMSGFASIDDRV